LIIFGTLSAGALFGIVYAGNLGIFQHNHASAADIIAALMGLIVSTIILYLNARQLEQSLTETRLSEQAQIRINQELLETKVSLEKQTYEIAQVNEQNTHRVEQLRLVAEVANSAASIQILDRLLPTISELISQRFGVYHTGIFLIDDSREYAILYAANSEGGHKMLANGYRVEVGGQGIVGFVTATGNPRLTINVGMDSVYFDNPYLPQTHSEITLPLKIAGETIGVLDLQSTDSDAFTQEDVEVLSILTNQLAIAIQNARSFESARRAVKEAETAYQQLTGETWGQFAKGQRMLGYHFDGVEAKSIVEGTKEIAGTTLQVPVRLRGREIGKLKLSSPRSDRMWSEDEILMTESIAERAALSLENARLLEDAQKRAAKERAISEGAARVSAALDVENILQATAEELERALGSSEIVIQLESEE
jgi:GAF domain-containing protein